SLRLKPEQRAAVPDEIELDVAAAPVRLEVALALAVRHRAPSLDDRRVRVDEVVADASRHRERAREAALVEVVEEDAADAARLVAMLEVEVRVACALHARIEIGAIRRQRVAADAMEMLRVLDEA